MNDDWLNPTARKYPGKLVYFGAGRLYQRFAFHVLQWFAFSNRQRSQSDKSGGAKTPIIQIKPEICAAEQKDRVSEMFGELLESVEAFPLPKPKIDQLRVVLHDLWNKLGPGGDSVRVDNAIRLFKNYLNQSCPDSSKLHFKTGEIFESARCPGNVADALSPSRQLNYWEKRVHKFTYSTEKPSNDATQAAELGIWRPMAEAGELKPHFNWATSMAEVMDQLRELASAGESTTSQFFGTSPETREELEELLSKLHSEAVGLIEQSPEDVPENPDTQGQPDYPPNGEFSNRELAEARNERTAAVRVDLEGHRICIRDTWYVVSAKAARILHELVEADGEYISISGIEGIRTRDLETLPPEVHALVEAQPGAGTRIPREKLRLN